jgi:DNA-binding NarL/FixJ family response regulator
VGKRILIFAGFSLFLLALILGYYSSSDLLALTTAGTTERVAFHLLVSATEVIVLLILTYIFRQDDRSFFCHPLPIALIAAVFGILSFVLLRYSQQLTAPLPALVGAALALGCAFSLLFVFWTSQLVHFSYRGSYLLIIGAHGVATVCDACFLAGFARPDGFDGITMLAALLLSSLCIVLLPKPSKSIAAATSGLASTSGLDAPQVSIREATPLLRNGVLTVSAFAFISGLILSNTGGAVSNPSGLQGFMLVASAAVLLIMLIPILVTNKPLKLENSYRVALPLSTLGFIIVPFLVSGLPTGISGILVTTGYMLTGIVLYCTVAEASRITGAPVLPLLAGSEVITLTCYMCGSLIGIPLFSIIPGDWESAAIIGLAILYLALFFVVPRSARSRNYALIDLKRTQSLGDSRMAGNSRATSNGSDDNQVNSFSSLATSVATTADISALAIAHSLNEREVAILPLMIEGRTLSRIGEELGLSTSGIKYHAHSLYGKLGVNSRDELLDLITTRSGTQGASTKFELPSLDLLTAREQEVAQMLVQGKTVEAIAQELVISTNTAKSHVRTIYSKLGIHSKQELIDLVRN